MRTKKEILDSTERNSKKATGPVDISLIHSLHTLEVFIDIRDIFNNYQLAEARRFGECFQDHE